MPIVTNRAARTDANQIKERRQLMVSSIGGGSGGFDMSAMKQMQEKMFKAMDTSGDGKVDKNEMSAFQKAQQADGKQGGPSVDEIFKNSDSNSDGGITLQEMQDSMA